MSESSTQKRILLAFPPVWNVDMPSLGLAYLVSYLKSKGIDVDTLDLNLLCYKNSSAQIKFFWEMRNSGIWVDDRTFLNIKLKLEPLFKLCLDEISKLNCSIIGFSVYSSNRLFTKELIKRIRKKISPELIIVGGRGVEAEDERNVFEDLVNIFVKGEGEKTLKEIIDNFYNGATFDNIPGVIRIKDKEIDNFVPREPILPLDNIPFPKYEDFDLEDYRTKSLPILMGKGCISKCAFCDDCNVMGKFRTKRAETVVEEIKFHIHSNKIRRFFFNDASINSDISELERLCDLIIKDRLDIEWIALAIPYSKMSYNLLSKMKKAGCKTLNFGVESGSDKVLKRMKKLFNSSEAEQVIRKTRRAGIDAQLNFIAGFPGEEEKEFQQTLEFIKRNRDYISGVTNVNTCNALLESEIFKEAKKYGINFPEDLRVRDTQWFIDESNTPKIRTQRVERVIELLNKLNIPIVISNIWEEKAKSEVTSVNLKINSTKIPLALVTTPPWGFENPPIGLAYLAEYMKHKNIDLEIIDLNILFYNKINPDYRMLWHIENKNFWSNEYTFPILMEIFKPLFNESVDKLLSIPSKLIGFSVVDPKERITIELIKKIKEKAPHKKIILGGPATSTEQQRQIFLDNISQHIEAFVIGEGEYALYDLVTNFKNGKGIENINSVLVKNNGGWRYNPGKIIEPIEKIPFPTYEKFNLDLYNRDWLWVEWSRGCPGRCSFCKNYKLVNKYRAKPAWWVVDELRFHVEKNGINKFFVVDNLLNGDLNQLRQICDSIIKNRLEIKWAGSMAPNKYMDYDFFKKMHKAGCYKLQIGLESGSNRVLKNMRKNFLVEISEKNIRDAKRAGITTEIFIMIGFPGEEGEDFKKTRSFIKRNSPYIDTIKSINTLHLIAGTDVYDNYEKYNIKPLPKNNWHYMWETYDGNNYKIRRKRGEILLQDALTLGLNVTETNLEEGKEAFLEQLVKKIDISNTEDVKQRLKVQINRLQELKIPQEKKQQLPVILKHYKKSTYKQMIIFLLRFPLISFLLCLGIITDFYCWILKKTKKCIIFPGS